MVSPLTFYRKFVKKLGPVEQAQVVASTAVVVSMVTIVTSAILTGQTIRLMDFVSILTIGIIGFTSVYFTLQYARSLENQRQQLYAMNTIAQSVNRVVELESVLQTALQKVTELLDIQYGWVYMLEGNELTLKCSKGGSFDFLSLNSSGKAPTSAWLNQPRVQRERTTDDLGYIPAELKHLGVQFWASIPLRAKDSVAGALIVAGNDYRMFTSKQAELMEAFGNQISVALHNAQLFDRLRRSERRYVDLFENSPDIYLNVNHHHVIVDCNQTGIQTLGYAKQEITGKPFEALFVPERQDDIREQLATMFSRGEGLKDVEEQMVLGDGETITVNLNSSLLFDETGSSVNARIVARDITHRKKMEATLFHAQKIDSIGNLAGGVAHDFNNILASILGSASIMRRRITEKGKLYKYVEIIEKSARRGSSLTRQLLTFARKEEIIETPVNINTLIMDTLHMFERSVSKQIVVETHLSVEPPKVKGDEGQIQQALLNLFLNARDAMPEGGTVTVSTAFTTADATTSSQFLSVKPGPYVVVTVSDTGSGIDQSLHTRIFEPFFTTKDHGTGLGLSVLYGVVQNHGGFINLESEVGRGATFSIYFPRLVPHQMGTEKRRKQRAPRGTEHILIIDDEASVREIARDILTDLGYTITTEYDGSAGVETYRIRQATIDLVLLDVNMPVMGGTAAFEQLRNINPDVPIIILTGYGKGVLDAPIFSTEVNGFLQKPFQLEDLALKVRQVLDKRIAAIQSTS
jgi:PAS domain S-box-containing protein